MSKVQLEKLENFTKAVGEFVSKDHITTDPYEIEATTGDLSILPKYHYKFKEEHVATHVIRPKNTEELSKVMEICKDYSLPVTVRAAGSSCYSASTPTKGGVVIDVRRMNNVINIDPEKMTVKCEAGISWLKLIESLLTYGLAPKCYPTSYKSSCVSGFVVTSGKAGIGVVKQGSIRKSLNSVTLVKPDGSIEVISDSSKGELTLDDIVGSFGVLGAVAEVEMSVTSLQNSMEMVGYSFNSIEKAIKLFSAIKENTADKPFFLSLSDKKFEKLSHVTIPTRNFFVYAVFYDSPETTSKAVSIVKGEAEKLDGLAVEDWYLTEKWRDIADTELTLGRLCNNPIFQEYWVADGRIQNFYETYAVKVKGDKYRNAFYMMGGPEGGNRIKLFGLSDIANSREFFGIKANFHEMVKHSYKNGDSIYTVGVVNTLYFLMYNAERVKYIQNLKDKLDPEDRLNSYRIVKAKMRIWRVKFLFWVAKFLFRMV